MPLTKKQNHWGVLRYLIYFTQVGVSVVTPPILCCFGALWLKSRFSLGNGVVIVGHCARHRSRSVQSAGFPQAHRAQSQRK